MTLFASLNNTPITRARLVIPYSGIWHADIWLDRVSDTTGPQALQIDALIATCAVVRQIDFTGESMLRVVGGAGGWRTQATAKLYAQANLSTILGDTATAVGEQVNVVTDSAITPFYVITSEDDSGSPMPASQVLQDLMGDQWYMDLSGVIQQGPRPSPAIASTFTLRTIDGPPGIYTVDSDNIADWLPGATFTAPTGSGTISRVEHILDAGKLTTQVMITAPSTTPSDRLRAAFESMLRQYLPDLLFLCEWTYNVVSVNGGPTVTIDANPVDPRMPPVSGLPLRPDASGGTAAPAIGAQVIVGFANGNRRQAEVRSLDPNSQPTGIWLGGGTNPLARLGDQVQTFFPPTLVFTGVFNGNPITGTINLPTPLTGVITEGSPIANGP